MSQDTSFDQLWKNFNELNVNFQSVHNSFGILLKAHLILKEVAEHLLSENKVLRTEVEILRNRRFKDFSKN